MSCLKNVENFGTVKRMLNCLYFQSFVFWHNSWASYLGVFKWMVVPVLIYLIVLICM